MILKEQVDDLNRRWKKFHEWEAQQPPVERSAAAIIADLGAIRQWLPEAVRVHDPDPEKKGVQAMFRALSVLKDR